MNITPIGRKLYLSILTLFVIFTVTFITFQHNREKEYKVSLLTYDLVNYNNLLYEVADSNGHFSINRLRTYLKHYNKDHVRVTVINADGHVSYDNTQNDTARMANHSNRHEVQEAIKHGIGLSVDRRSTTNDREYFYTANYYAQHKLLIRSALPYNRQATKRLDTDNSFIWVAIITLAILTIILYKFTNTLSNNITKLRTFALRASRNESLETEELATFSNDELGEIAERIIKIYKNLQQTKQEQEVLKQQLTQNAAHELKTPVAGIQGYIETIIANPDMDKNTRMLFLQKCNAQIQRLTTLLNDLSTLNRLDDGAHLLQKEQVNITEIWQEIVQETTLARSEKHIEIVHNLNEPLMVEGNRSMLYSVFRNLADNAMAYAGHDITITLHAEQTEENIRFSFADNGIGVAKHHLPRLFERFYRVDKGRSRKLGGTGLGLAIVKNAINVHGGTIRALPNEGGGLRFIFHISKKWRNN